jgi:hypothetical protein
VAIATSGKTPFWQPGMRMRMEKSKLRKHDDTI